MKVTVCFGELKVVVPCGDGDFLVSELIEKAVTRYKKATGKPSDLWVKVHALKNQRDGGILDLDDALNDVVDDKDQILAEFEEQRVVSSPEQGEGDGTSGSSVGSVSPDISSRLLPPSGLRERSLGAGAPVTERRVLTGKAPPPVPPPKPVTTTGNSSVATAQQQSLPLGGHQALGSRNSVVVTETDLSKATGLQVLKVRRGSESNLVTLATGDTSGIAVGTDVAGTLLKSEVKQWLPRNADPNLVMAEMHETSTDSADDEECSGVRKVQLVRDSARRSLTGDTVLKWTASMDDQGPPSTMRSRREPLGQSGSLNIGSHQEAAPLLPTAGQVVLVALDSSTEGPLGIHVVPNIVDGRDAGLVIQDIEPGGRIDQDGRFSLYDLIEQINEHDLMSLSFEEAQSIFRQALVTNRIVLRIRKNGGAAMAAEFGSSFEPPDASGAKEPGTSEFLAICKGVGLPKPGKGSVAAPFPEATPPLKELVSSDSKEKSLSAASPPSTQQHQQASRSPSAQLTSPSSTLMKANTRKMGKRLAIELLKGPEGLGFSITTRDNPAGGVAPIYVKNILPKGAAIADGRLKSGDRILEINGIDTTGKSQDEAVAMLRNTKRGSTVSFVVSRQELADQSATLPRQLLPTQDHMEDSHSTQNGQQVQPASGILAGLVGKQLHVFDIPLNESGSAGLGVSVKGKTSTTEDGAARDLGIFVKAVINGGAASKDGRVMVNDQLIEINGESLVDKSNTAAMDALRKAMRNGEHAQGHIRLRVARAPGTASNMSGASFSSASEPLDHEEIGMDSSSRGSSTVRQPSPQSGRGRALASVEQCQPAAAQAAPQNGPLRAAAPVNGLRNPVLDRLTGSSRPGAGSRGSDRDEDDMSGGGNSSSSSSSDDPMAAYGTNATTLPTPRAPRDTVIIEDDSQPVIQRREKPLYPRQLSRSSGGDLTKARPYSAIGGVGLLGGVDEILLTESTDVGGRGVPTADIRNVGIEKHRESTSSATGTFDREGFGRRSFSEKRKVEKNKELVEKAKALREDAKEKVQDEPEMKRTNLSENERAVAVEELAGGNGGSGSPVLWRPLTQVARGRGCNESFRAAVDKSYDGSPAAARAAHAMSMVQEEGSESGSGAVHDSSARSSFSDPSGPRGSHNTDRGFDGGGKSQKKDKKTPKVTSGGFLGNLLRFTKGRKSMEDRVQSQGQPSASVGHQQPSSMAGRLLSDADGKATKGSVRPALQQQATTAETHKIEERYRRLQDTQRAQLVAAASTASSSSSGSSMGPSVPFRAEYGDYAEIPARDPAASARDLPGPPLSSHDKITRLRQEHRDHHVERHGRYPLDEREDFYEQKIRERETREWEANNRANVGNGLNANWRLPLMIDRGGSDTQHIKPPPYNATLTGLSGPASVAAAAGTCDGSRPYLYESNGSGRAASASELVAVAKERQHAQRGGTDSASDYSSLTRSTRARTPEPQPWKRQQLTHASSHTLRVTGDCSSGGGSGLYRGHQRYASFDSTGGSSSSTTCLRDYDDPRHAYAEPAAALSLHQRTRQPAAPAIGLRHDVPTGAAQV